MVGAPCGEMSCAETDVGDFVVKDSFEDAYPGLVAQRAQAVEIGAAVEAVMGAGDGAVLAVRRCLLGALKQFMAGEVPQLAQHEAIDYSGTAPQSKVVTGESEWRAML